MIDYSGANIRMWSRLGSCGAFGAAMMALAENDDALAVTTADLCFYSGLDRFKQKYSHKLYNIGIAEQNMIGIAAGMAKEGMNVFATTYATFATTRALDQVRVNMGYMKFPIKLVGLTSGLCVGILGATHMSIEDIATIRAIPNITILSPADCTETVKATIAAAIYNQPVYLRLTGSMISPVVFKQDYDFEIGKAITLQEGKDVCIVATGSMVHTSLQAAQMLSEQGIDCTVVNMHTIKPLDTNLIDRHVNKKLIVTVEEHSVIGGLGGAVAEHFALEMNKPPHMIIGLPQGYPHAGDYNFLLKQAGLTAQDISAKICSFLK